MDEAMGILIDAKRCIDFAQRLVRVRSVFEPESGCDESAAAELVLAEIADFGWEVEVIRTPSGRPNIVARVLGGLGVGHKLAFEGHMDVVTEGNVSEWRCDPYGGIIEGGCLYGRGAADMKAGLAAMIYGVRAFELAGPFAGEIHLCVLSDEEGCMSGAKALVKSGIINQVDGVVVCEPEGGEICIASKGAMRLRVRVRGQMAHGAMPKEGRNPIVGVGRLIAAMQKMEREFYIDHSQEGNMEELYLTPTVVRVGDERQMNVISEEGFLYLDVRTTPGIDHEQLIHNVGAVVDACGEAVGLSMDLEVIDDRPSVFTGKDSSLVRCLSEAYREVFGKAPALGTVPGTTDGTILARDLGLNVVVCGPGGKWIAHKVDEYVEVDEIVRYGRVFAECARRFLGLESV